MHPQARFGFIIGAVVGLALGVFLYLNGGGIITAVAMVPIGAIMGAAPWLLKPKE